MSRRRGFVPAGVHWIASTFRWHAFRQLIMIRPKP
jgi:hypothetical protein